MPSKHSPWWRRLEDVFVSKRYLQDILIKMNIFTLVILKTSWTFPRRLEDVFKTSSRRLQDVLQKRLQNVFKKSWKDVLKTFSRLVQDVLSSKYSACFWHVQRRRLSTERLAWVTLLRNLWSRYKIFKNELFGCTETFKVVF